MMCTTKSSCDTHSLVISSVIEVLDRLITTVPLSLHLSITPIHYSSEDEERGAGVSALCRCLAKG